MFMKKGEIYIKYGFGKSAVSQTECRGYSYDKYAYKQNENQRCGIDSFFSHDIRTILYLLFFSYHRHSQTVASIPCLSDPNWTDITVSHQHITVLHQHIPSFTESTHTTISCFPFLTWLFS